MTRSDETARSRRPSSARRKDTIACAVMRRLAALATPILILAP